MNNRRINDKNAIIIKDFSHKDFFCIIAALFINKGSINSSGLRGHRKIASQPNFVFSNKDLSKIFKIKSLDFEKGL